MKQIKLVDGWNAYAPLREDAGCTELECTVFNDREDLGDGIMCLAAGQRMWVANYFVQNMKDADL